MNKWLKPGKVSAKYVPMADGLRALCVFLVAWFHIWQQSWLNPVMNIGPVRLDFNGPVSTGYMMVDVMLLLSGFLLFLPWARVKVYGHKPPDTRQYFIKRGLRILPSYLLSIFIVLFFYALPGHEYGSVRHFLLDILGHLTFTHNLTFEGYIGSRMSGVLWTLAVEVQFYLIAPLLGRAFVKKPFLTYAGMAAVAFVYRFVYVAGMTDTSLYFNRLPAMLDVYANGMMAAWLYVYLARRFRDNGVTGAAALAVTVLSLAGMWIIMQAQASRRDSVNYWECVRMGQMIYRFPLTALAAVAIVAGCHAPRAFTWLFSNRLVRFLAGISYNYYIWHSHIALRLRAWHIPPYVDEMPQRAGAMPWQRHYTYLCFIAAFAAAALITYLWEKPMSRLGARFLLKEESSPHLTGGGAEPPAKP